MKQPTLRTEMAVLKVEMNYMKKLIYVLIIIGAGSLGIDNLDLIQMGLGI